MGGYNPRRSRLRIDHEREHLFHLPVVCNQCENAYCATACPLGAITRNKDGMVRVDHDTCVGCGICSNYCPLGMIQLDPELKKAVKCECCNGSPKCVEACPTGALEWVIPAGGEA